MNFHISKWCDLVLSLIGFHFYASIMFFALLYSQNWMCPKKIRLSRTWLKSQGTIRFCRPISNICRNDDSRALFLQNFPSLGIAVSIIWFGCFFTSIRQGRPALCIPAPMRRAPGDFVPWTPVHTRICPSVLAARSVLYNFNLVPVSLSHLMFNLTL